MAVYACSDLHGRKDVFEKLLDSIAFDDKIFYLGDACDRGPAGWELIKSIGSDSRFTYILGNHEQMLLDAYNHHFQGQKMRLYEMNSGDKTVYDCTHDTKENQIQWINFIRNLPRYYIYQNANNKTIILSHAGFTPPLCQGDDLLWDREHFYYEWPNGYDNVIVVHGHTPIPYLRQKVEGNYKNGAYYYNKHKICIDNRTVNTGTTCLLNLDTLEPNLISIN